MFWHKDSFVHFSSIVARHPVMPRGTTAEECEILVDGIGRELIKSVSYTHLTLPTN